MLSVPHMIVVFIVVLVVFGPQKLPELARGLGKLMAEFRKASTDFKSAFDEEMREMERQTRITKLKKQAASEVAAAAMPDALALKASPASAELQPVQLAPDARMSEAPVIAPMAGSVARSSRDTIEETTGDMAQANSAEEAPLDTPSSAALDPLHDKPQTV